MRFKFISAALAALSMLAAGSALAEYPDRSVTLIVPFPPGGTADTMARAVQPALERALKQSVVVLNKPGAGGAIGLTNFANSPADGYTILCSLLSVASLPEQAVANKQKPPFTLDQLKPAAMLSREPIALVVPAASPYKTFGEFMAAAKAKPDELTYGSTGFFGEVHVRTEGFDEVAGIKARHVPYQGGGPLVTALLANEVNFALLSPSLSIAHVKGGKMRYLATAGDEPWSDPSGLPRMKDLGVDFDAVASTALFIRSGLPESVERTLRQAIETAAQDPEFKRLVMKTGGSPHYMGGSQFATFWQGYVSSISALTNRIVAREAQKATR